jgi:hypothetical protein
VSYLADRLDAFSDELIKIGAASLMEQKKRQDEWSNWVRENPGKLIGAGTVLGAMTGGLGSDGHVSPVGGAIGGGLGALWGVGLHHFTKEKTAGMFSRIGKGIANTLEQSKGARGVLPAPPPMPSAPSMDVGALRKSGRKAMRVAGTLGIGAAGGAYAMHQAHQDSLGKLTGQ